MMACHLFGAGLLSFGTLGTNFSAISIKIQNFSFTKMHLKISSAKRRPFCPGGDELTQFVNFSFELFSVNQFINAH